MSKRLVSLLAVLSLALPMQAAVLIHLTFDEMTDQSSAIFLGRCVDVRSAWSNGDIVTHNVFEVTDYYKGNLGSRVTLTELGGQVGNTVAAYSGIPRFRVGEEAVLFVWTGPGGSHQALGLPQGKFRIKRDAKSGDISLTQTSAGEPMVEPPQHSHRESVESLSFPLAAFRGRIALALQRRSGVSR